MPPPEPYKGQTPAVPGARPGKAVPRGPVAGGAGVRKRVADSDTSGDPREERRTSCSAQNRRFETGGGKAERGRAWCERGLGHLDTKKGDGHSAGLCSWGILRWPGSEEVCADGVASHAAIVRPIRRSPSGDMKFWLVVRPGLGAAVALLAGTRWTILRMRWLLRPPWPSRTARELADDRGLNFRPRMEVFVSSEADGGGDLDLEPQGR